MQAERGKGASVRGGLMSVPPVHQFPPARLYCACVGCTLLIIHPFTSQRSCSSVAVYSSELAGTLMLGAYDRRDRVMLAAA